MAQETRRVPPEMVEVMVVVLRARACPSQLPRQPSMELPAQPSSNWTRTQNHIQVQIQGQTQCRGWERRSPARWAGGWSLCNLPSVFMFNRKLSLQRNYLCVAQLCSNKQFSKILKHIYFLQGKIKPLIGNILFYFSSFKKYI